MQDIRCKSREPIATVFSYQSEEALTDEFHRLQDRGVLLERRKAKRAGSYPFWLVCEKDSEDAVLDLGHRAEDLEHLLYGAVCDQSDAWQAGEEGKASGRTRPAEGGSKSDLGSSTDLKAWLKAEADSRADANAKRRAEQDAKEEAAKFQADEARRLAELEEKRRADEAERRAGIQVQRREDRLCTLCGKPLGVVDKLFGKENHPGCSLFQE
jgi:hypothetical protein